MSTGVGSQRGDESTPSEPTLFGTESDDGDDALSRERLFDVLANRRRRYALHYLKDVEGPIELGELSEHVAAWENECEVSAIDSAQRKRVYTALQQSHLPVMDEAGVVRFDKDRGIVEPSEHLDDVDIYFDLVRGRDVPWSEYYLGLAALGAGIVAAFWAGLWPVTVVPGIAWAVFLVVSLGVSAVAHEYQTRRNKVGTDGPPPEVAE